MEPTTRPTGKRCASSWLAKSSRTRTTGTANTGSIARCSPGRPRPASTRCRSVSEYGGAGEPDYRYRMVVSEEIARINALSFGLTISLQDDLVLHYLLDLTNDEQKQRWLPGFASGEIIGALAMTEPGAGSDLQGHPHHRPQGWRRWVLNGQKTFISSGIMADLVVVAARTNPDGGSGGVQPVRRRTRHTGLRAGPSAREDRPARPGHLRTVLQRRDRSRSQSARRRRPRTPLPDEPPAP